MPPFDQILVYLSGGKFPVRTIKTYDSGPAKDERIGRTANANPSSAFSFIGNRRNKIVSYEDPADTDVRLRIHHFRYTGEDSTTAEPVNNISPANFEQQNRESAHNYSNCAIYGNSAGTPTEHSDHLFKGIHEDDKLEVTATENFNGAYLVLKCQNYFYNQYNVNVKGSTKETVYSGTTLDTTKFTDTIKSDGNGGGSDISVKDAVVDTTMVPKLVAPESAMFNFKYIAIYKNGTLLKPSGYHEVDTADSGTAFNGTATHLGNFTCSKSGGTITFNDGTSGTVDPRYFFHTSFKIRIDGTEYEVQTVTNTGITVNNTTDTHTNKTYVIMIPKGSPASNTIFHPAGSRLNSSASSSNSFNATWGLCPNKHFDTTSTIFDNNPDDAYPASDCANFYDERGLTPSPFFGYYNNDNDGSFSNKSIRVWEMADEITFGSNNIAITPANYDTALDKDGATVNCSNYAVTAPSFISRAIWPDFPILIRDITDPELRNQYDATTWNTIINSGHSNLSTDSFATDSTFDRTAAGFLSRLKNVWRAIKNISAPFQISTSKSFPDFCSDSPTATGPWATRNDGGILFTLRKVSIAFFENWRRSVQCYPYLIGCYGGASYRNATPNLDCKNASGGHLNPRGAIGPPLTSTSQSISTTEKPLYIPIFETDDVIRKGEKFEVSLQTACQFATAEYAGGDNDIGKGNFAGGSRYNNQFVKRPHGPDGSSATFDQILSEGNSATRGSIIFGNFQLYLIAKDG